MAISGSNFTRFSRHSLKLIPFYWPKLRDTYEIRRYALTLRNWDLRHLEPPGTLNGYSYEKIKALRTENVYEMRLDDTIGGQANIRVVFFDPPGSWTPLQNNIRPMRVNWILEVLPKTRNGWTTNDIARFRFQQVLLKNTFYKTV